MVHKIEEGKEKESDDITLGKVVGFYKEAWDEVKPKGKKAEGEKKEEEVIDLDGGHVV